MERMLHATPNYDPTLGWSLNPIKAVKSAAKGVAKVGKVVAKGTVKYAIKPAVKATLAPAVLVKDVATGKNVLKSVVKSVKSAASPILTPASAVGSLALKPLRNKINTLRSRRAVKLAWDRRRSKTPSPQEHAEAKSWTKAKLKSSGPHGHVLALFAGPAGMYDDDYALGAFGEPITIATVAASLPILLAVVNALTKKAGSSGEAPADPSVTAGRIIATAATQALAPYAQQPAPAVEEIQQQDMMTEEPMQVPVDATEPSVELPAEEPVAGYYFGASELSTGQKVGLVAGLLVVIGAGVYVARG